MSALSPLVIKVGGDLAADPAQCQALAADLSQLQRQRAVVVVHGGGPQATALTQRLGLTPVIVGGRRVTDADTLWVMKMILSGQVNVDLTTTLGACGLKSVGISGVAAQTVQAQKRPPRVVSGSNGEAIDFGFVGDIVAIDPTLIRGLCELGFIPVMDSLGVDPSGQVFNINADIVATRLAQALGATLVLTTGGVPGVLRDRHDPSSRIDRLDSTQARAAIAEGTIQAGMIPKIEESLLALAAGVPAVHILGQVVAGHLLAELTEPGCHGTALVP